MKIYKVVIAAQIWYTTEVHAESEQEAKDCARDELDNLIGTDIRDYYTNSTTILSEREEEEEE